MKYLTSKIQVVVDGKPIGEAFEVKVKEKTPTSPVYDAGSPDSIPVDGRTEYELEVGRIRFDRERIAEAFNRGHVSIQAQSKPVQLVMRDNFVGVGIVDTNMENCWMWHIWKTYYTDEFVILENVKMYAEDVWSDLNNTKVVIDKMVSDIRKEEDERILERIRSNLESGEYKKFNTDEKQDPVVITKGRAVGKSTEVGADAINQVRKAIFEIENEISVSKRLEESIKPNGEIKASALTGIDYGIGESKSTETIVSPGGVTCKKCGDFNEYCTTPSEPDGTHICYRCRSGF
jgi:hypothetical protein